MYKIIHFNVLLISGRKEKKSVKEAIGMKIPIGGEKLRN